MNDPAEDAFPNGRVLTVQVGRARTLTTATGRQWRSAIVKEAAEGAVELAATGCAGDEQANRKYHGGPDKAVCAYFAASYPLWRDELNLNLPPGAFGENLTLGDLTEDDLCVGDVLAVGGEARLEVSQPRMPCVNVARRWGVPSLPKRMERTGRTGFYARVVRPGAVAAGDPVSVAVRPHPGWTLRRANALLYGPDADPAEIAALRDLPALSAEWKRALGRRLRKLAAISP